MTLADLGYICVRSWSIRVRIGVHELVGLWRFQSRLGAGVGSIWGRPGFDPGPMGGRSRDPWESPTELPPQTCRQVAEAAAAAAARVKFYATLVPVEGQRSRREDTHVVNYVGVNRIGGPHGGSDTSYFGRKAQRNRIQDSHLFDEVAARHIAGRTSGLAPRQHFHDMFLSLQIRRSLPDSGNFGVSGTGRPRSAIASFAWVPDTGRPNFRPFSGEVSKRPTLRISYRPCACPRTAQQKDGFASFCVPRAHDGFWLLG